jgi:flagellar hook protein FlgE
MSLYGMMRTSASGMAAQANRLATVADNIANMSTVGYKRASTEFASMILESSEGSYVSGSVRTDVRYAISQQGTIAYTTSSTDLAVDGNGFFLVGGGDDQIYMTRAGSFVKDGEGRLVNAAGYYLMGYPLTNGDPTVVANGYAGLEVINIGDLALQANPTTQGNFYLNLPVNADPVPAANLPSVTSGAGAQFTAKSSLVMYDNVGNEVILDVYSSKVADNEWEVTVYNRADAAATGGFPYSSAALTTVTLEFDPTTGQLNGAATSLTIPVPNGQSVVLDMSQSSELAANYTVLTAEADGNAPSSVDKVEFSSDGVLYAVFTNGARVATHRIPLATVASPDNLQPLPGNVYTPSADSGNVQVGFAGEGGFGKIATSAVEQSTVDLAAELTAMIESQRNYTANSKVFQTGADLMDVLVNLKR